MEQPAISWRNLICAAGILFSGANPSKVFKYFRSIGVNLLAPRTYNLLQRIYLIPCVSEVWSKHQVVLLQEFQRKHLTLGGDGWCDSPGHSAKYGSYSLMEMGTNKVLDLQVVQVMAVRRNAVF